MTSISQDIFGGEVEIDRFEKGGEGVALVRADLGDNLVRRFRGEQARGRDGIARLRRLAEPDRHRLVAHERLVFRRKFGKVFLSQPRMPPLRATMSPFASMRRRLST